MGYCHLFGCSSICGTSPLEGPEQQFQLHFFFISTHKHNGSYAYHRKNHKNLNKSCQNVLTVLLSIILRKISLVQPVFCQLASQVKNHFYLFYC